MPRFTFGDPVVSTKKNNNIKLDNAGGVLYTAMKKSKIRNPRFKPAFVASLPRTNNYSKTVASLLETYNKTGSLKCSCCESSEAYFVLHVEYGRATFRAMVDVNKKPTVLTVDHNLLKSLGGEDSTDNYNPLCYECNQIRGSLFAEFKEFKEWYDSKEVVDISTKPPSANFCHVDYMQNLNNSSHFETIKGSTSLPPNVMNTLRKEIRRDTYDIFDKLSIKVWLKMDRDFANKVLNELVLERVHNRLNKRNVPLQNHNFFNYSKTMSDHRKIKLHIVQQIVSQIRKLRNYREPVDNFTDFEMPMKKEVTETNVSFLKNIWSSLRKVFY